MQCSTKAECSGGDDCCEGFCIDTSSSPDHCGGCGKPCSVDNAEASCAASECGVGTCKAGFADCNGMASDGCETDDVGLPSVPVVIAPIVGAYTGSVHAAASLKPKFTWKASKVKGSCDSLSYQIQLTTECTLGQLQSCKFAKPTVDEQGLTAVTWTPGSALAASTDVPTGDVYFWRVRACETDTRCSDWSAVRYLNVGRLRDDLNGDGYSDVLMVGKSNDATIRGMFFVGGASPPISADATLDTKIGSQPEEARFVGDVNGDGFQDAVVWNYNVTAEIPRVILGSDSLDAVTIVSMSDALSVSHAAGAMGDFDADGFADVAVSEYDFTTPGGTPHGVVHMFRGRADFTLDSPVDVSPPTGTKIQFGRAVEGGMDMNRDGYGDFAVLDGDDRAIYVFSGGVDAPLEIADTLKIPYACNLSSPPSTLLAAGDMTGDGYEDLAAFCATSDANKLGDVYVFRGGNPPPADPTWSELLETTFGQIALVGGRDLGSDGLADLITTTKYGSGVPPYSQFLILPGSVDTTLLPTTSMLGNDTDQFSANVTIGDYDGNGAWDVLITAAAFQGTSERRWLLGGKSGANRCTTGSHQSAGSYPEVGDWCTAVAANLYKPSPNYDGRYAR